MAELTVIWWRDIPAQVTARAGRGRTARVQLTDRFQEAIDSAAMTAGLTGTDEYLVQWRRETRPCGDELEEHVRAEAARLEAKYTDETLQRLARSSGTDAT